MPRYRRVYKKLCGEGGVATEHRTDSLSAAYNNLAEKEELTRNYKALCQHYGMNASRNNPEFGKIH